MSNYILKWRGGAKADEGTEREKFTSIWLVGPFPSEEEACVWAQKDQADHGDDPRWQSVTLFGAPVFSTSIRVHQPEDPAA